MGTILFRAMTLNTATLGIMTLSKIVKIVALGMTIRYTKFCKLVIMLNVIKLNVILLNVVMLNVIMLNVIMLNVIMLNVIL